MHRIAVGSLPSWISRFGIRSARQLGRDLASVVRHAPQRDRYTFDLASAGLLRPSLALPAWAGFIPDDGVAPIFNFFDRTGGGRGFRSTVTRARMRDWRGGRLSYDEHDGTDFVCPPGTPLVAAAPGRVVATRDRWLRGGLTLSVDHGEGVLTQYTHLVRVLVPPGHTVERGEPIALAGHSGFDMTQFFPWVPPHLHFLVAVGGVPVDPYGTDGEPGDGEPGDGEPGDGEPARAGRWQHGNDPLVAHGALAGDANASSLAHPAVLGEGVRRVLALCRDPRIVDEVERLTDEAARVAVLEDSLHHDRPAWPEEARAIALRPPADVARASRIVLTLPLTSAHYRRARAADTSATRPV